MRIPYPPSLALALFAFTATAHGRAPDSDVMCLWKPARAVSRSPASGPAVKAAPGAGAVLSGAVSVTSGDLIPLAQQLQSAAMKSDLLRQVSSDLVADVRSRDFDLKLTDEQLRQFEMAWNAYLANPKGTGITPVDTLPSEFSNLLKRPLPTPAPAVGQLQSVPVANIPGGAKFSMPDFPAYADARLGATLSKLVRDKKVATEIYGGSAETLAAMAKRDGLTLQRIPSLYDQWGVEKFVASAAGKPDSVIIRVPPIEQYVAHYGDIIKAEGGILTGATINETDHAAYRLASQTAAKSLYQQLTDKPDYVVMGYGSRWLEALKQPESAWTVASSQTVRNKSGLSLTNLVMRSKADPAITQKVALLANEQTMWGEGSSFLAEGLLEENPKGLIFLGSAGAPGKNINVFDVTVPSKFLTRDGQVDIQNFLAKDASTAPQITKSGVTIRYGITHGNTVSPAEQTLAFTKSQVSRGTGTMDVEQSLVAKAVADHNKASGAHVLFGAANVVTDKPAIDEDARAITATLSHFDYARKTQSQLAAVKTVQDSLAQNSTRTLSQEEFHPTLASITPAAKAEPLPARVVASSVTDSVVTSAAAPAPTDADRVAMIQKMFPKVDPKNIVIQNGQGKVLVDDVDKVSYYVYTQNPSDASSNTILIPMSTSRFDSHNYHTNEWWDAHQAEIQAAKVNHTPMPREDPHAVAAYLESKGLSTNPDVLLLDVKAGQSSTTKLRDFLMQDYMSRFTDGDSVVLYRGAEKAGELEGWQAGTVPHGVRYWTPDANYAWRYGRKDQSYLQGLVENTTPVFKYKVPKAEFERMVRNGDLVLGTEITRSAHVGFDYQHRFVDSLGGYDYMGDARYGVDWEIRATSRGRTNFPQYFQGAVGVDEMADVRIKRIHDATARLFEQNPGRAAELKAAETARVAEVQAERDLIHGLQQHKSPAEIQALLQKTHGAPHEITDSTENLDSFATEYSNSHQGPVVAGASAAGPSCSTAFSGIAK